MKSIQVGTKNDPLGIRPGLVQKFLSSDGISYGYGYGPGWSLIFEYKHGEVQVEAGQWITLDDDGIASVSDDI